MRMVVLVADAPPHVADYYGDLSGRYDHTVFDAVAQGIKIFPVGAKAAGTRRASTCFRQLAQITGGNSSPLLRDGSDPSSGPRHGDRPRRGELLGQHAGPAHRTPGAGGVGQLDAACTRSHRRCCPSPCRRRSVVT
ncbi:MAG: hypothetical protein R2838_05440 [Caldilineaceae bacterium]